MPAAREHRLGDDLADAHQEVGAHGRQVALGVVARDREQAEAARSPSGISTVEPTWLPSPPNR